MAAAFQTYFVGDDSFTAAQNAEGSLFVSAQSVQKLTYPNVLFTCLEAKEVAPGTGNYQNVELHVSITTPLSERPDDYPSLLALHGQRIAKAFILLENAALLQTLTNQPTPPAADPRTVTDFFLYGFGEVTKELEMPNPHHLVYLISIQVTFRPQDA